MFHSHSLFNLKPLTHVMVDDCLVFTCQLSKTAFITNERHLCQMAVPGSAHMSATCCMLVLYCRDDFVPSANCSALASSEATAGLSTPSPPLNSNHMLTVFYPYTIVHKVR